VRTCPLAWMEMAGGSCIHYRRGGCRLASMVWLFVIGISLVGVASDSMANNSGDEAWPGCQQQSTVLRHRSAYGLFTDLVAVGAKDGCYLSDCTYTDKFICPSLAECGLACSQVEGCAFWTYEPGIRQCFLRKSDAGREASPDFVSGARACHPPASSSPGAQDFMEFTGQRCSGSAYTAGYPENDSCNGWAGLTKDQCWENCQNNAQAPNCPQRTCVAMAHWASTGWCHLYSQCPAMHPAASCTTYVMATYTTATSTSSSSTATSTVTTTTTATTTTPETTGTQASDIFLGTTTTTTTSSGFVTGSSHLTMVVACVGGTIAIALCAAVVVTRMGSARGHRKAETGDDSSQATSTCSDSDESQIRPDVHERAKVIAGKDRHRCVPPSRWCVSPEQLFDLLDVIEERYPDEDPNVYRVVDEVIKPMTEEHGCSYALMLNPGGIHVSHFITHAWAEGFKAFTRSLRDASITGGLWICFLANPQTWPSSELAMLLGTNPFMSPFYCALRESDNVIAVRNSNMNMYTRLWCVFELWSAFASGKPIKTTGPNPDQISPADSG